MRCTFFIHHPYSIMSLSLTILASGSKGNAMVLESRGKTYLIDAGLSSKALCSRLCARGYDPAALSGILITHDHSDHISAIDVFTRKYDIPIYANESTAAAIERGCKQPPTFVIFESDTSFDLDDGLTVDAFRVPHDAAEAVGYTISTAKNRLLITTDLGQINTAVARAISRATAIVLESNHDYEMLRNSGRVSQLIGRIHGRFGHLENCDACQAIAQFASPALKHVILAHLSGDCNNPALAKNLMSATIREINRPDITIDIATQETGAPTLILN